MVFETGTLGWETKTMVSKPETIFFATGKMVFPIKKILSFKRTMVSGTETRVSVKNTMVPNVGDHGHGRTENGVGRVDHGLQGFVHRIFDGTVN